MKGTTNAQRGAADVVQNTSKVEILGASLQNATDSQPGVMSAADHQKLTNAVSGVSEAKTSASTALTTAQGKQDKITVSASEPTASQGADGDLWAVYE